MTRLQQRQILFGVGILCVLLALVFWGIVPAYNYRAELKDKQQQTRVRLQELKALKAEYEQARSRSGNPRALGSKGPEFTLFSYLEQQASRDGVKEQIAYMRPSSDNLASGVVEEQVQMRLENIRLPRLVAFLESIEYAPESIFVKRMTIRSPRASPGQLRSDLVIVTYRMES
jgi:general secretion pathway protein M